MGAGGQLGHVKGSEVIRLEKQSNGRAAYMLKKAKQSQTKKKEEHRVIFFASREQTRRNTGGFEGKRVLLAKRR